MRVLTLRGVIRNVAEAWRHQYAGWDDEPWQRKLRELEALDLDLTTPEQVVAITGNNSWVDMRCGICDVPTDVVIVLRQHSSRVDVCAACIKKANRMLEQEPGGPWNVSSEPGAWLNMAQKALAKAEGGDE